MAGRHIHPPNTDAKVKPAQHTVHDQHGRPIADLRVLHAPERRIDHRRLKPGQALLVAPQIPSVAREPEEGEPSCRHADGCTTKHA